jgi:hypothetical protein
MSRIIGNDSLYEIIIKIEYVNLIEYHWENPMIKIFYPGGINSHIEWHWENDPYNWGLLQIIFGVFYPND